jgi:hypothetical protein
MQEFLEQWADRAINCRADKDWTPVLYAHPKVVAKYPVLVGYTVHADAAMADNCLEVRTLHDHPSINERGPHTYPAGFVMSSYGGVR